MTNVKGIFTLLATTLLASLLINTSDARDITSTASEDKKLPPGLTCNNSQAYVTSINKIQGTGNRSSEVGNQHIVDAIVTAQRENGFFIQQAESTIDNDATTSEGLFVIAPLKVPIGHRVMVKGVVNELSGMTTLMSSVDDVIDCGTGISIKPIFLDMPLTLDLETVEGMKVKIKSATVVNTNNLWRFGELAVSNTLKRQPSDTAIPLSEAYLAAKQQSADNIIIIEDNSDAKHPSSLSFYPAFSYDNPIRIGDSLDVVGTVNEANGSFRINPIEPIKINSTREALPTIERGNLSVATFNVLNYFNGERDQEGNVNFNYDGNRGAKDYSAFLLQQARIVNAIIALNADVIGLMEVENDGFAADSAIASLTHEINAQLDGDKHYRFISTTDGTPVGTDAITVGLLYRESVVLPSGTAQVIPMPEQQINATKFARMRPTLLQSFTHIDSNIDFVVAVNHFKSKGSKCAEDLSSQVSQQDIIQGSCNALRNSAAVTLGEAMRDSTLPLRQIIMGDFNAYSAEDPIAVLTDYSSETRGYPIKTATNTHLNSGKAVAINKAYHFINLADRYDKNGFSYWFYGSEQVGSLDHVLVSSSMAKHAIDATHWNINSVEAYQLQYNQALRYFSNEKGYAFSEVGPYRSSDHDPFIATFHLSSNNN
ncbi:nuclease [Alteromonas sp. KC3]|uniref:ExeM/NucH family extracellular endonuclease n=1 Tax=unclassified Alteromonas TaxID=2614992 RepID=UPI001922E696|nr:MULTISPECIES: ExeM/NucH family extracellular endonuclease [unclassified Alteromonas]BCO19414.1 nuclease [Alteromonas sp. KC3]BCO23376.1 nuclease [Alteromonas sp. KC14]